jgi:hypothetical protein
MLFMWMLGATYHFQVLFKSDVLSNASYKIPLTCDFQTIDEKSFSIVRTFVSKKIRSGGGKIDEF